MAKRSSPIPPPPPSVLIPLVHHRWAVPVLAELHRRNGAKFVTLANRLAVGRDTLSRTLKALEKRGWTMRNPGHGHPMRPEYVLTNRGQSLGPACTRLYDTVVDLSLTDVALRKWSLPVLLAVGKSPRRFQDLAAALPDVTARALTQSLKTLVEAQVITRTLLDEFPPRPIYGPAPGGKRLFACVEDMAVALEGCRP